MIRSSKWIFPSEFSNLNISLPIPNPFFPLSERFDLANPFPNQNETSPDILVAANHFIIPRMRLTQLDPLIAFGYWLEPLPESIWRYETLLDLILQYYERIVFFGPDPDAPVGPHEIDDREYVSAGWLIDFLNPNGRSTFYIDKGKPLNGEVEGHHAVMNNTTREFRALYGYYQDPWVGVKLMPFVEWYYETD